MPLDNDTGLRVTIPVERAQPILYLGRVSSPVLVLNLGAAAVRARHLEVIREVLIGIRVLPLPPVVDYRVGVVLLQWLSTGVLSLQVRNGGFEVHAPLLLEVPYCIPAHLPLQLQPGQEVRSGEDLV